MKFSAELRNYLTGNFLNVNKNSIALIIASFLGTGFFPVASGSFASLIAIVLFWIIPLANWIWILILVPVFIIGVVASSKVEIDKGKDPKIVVIDEITGQWVALLFLPRTIPVLIAALFLFRFFDITKLYPANKMEQLKGGFGIMMDDLVAGIYTNVVLQIYFILQNSYLS